MILVCPVNIICMIKSFIDIRYVGIWIVRVSFTIKLFKKIVHI